MHFQQYPKEYWRNPGVYIRVISRQLYNVGSSTFAYGCIGGSTLASRRHQVAVTYMFCWSDLHSVSSLRLRPTSYLNNYTWYDMWGNEGNYGRKIIAHAVIMNQQRAPFSTCWDIQTLEAMDTTFRLSTENIHTLRQVRSQGFMIKRVCFSN